MERGKSELAMKKDIVLTKKLISSVIPDFMLCTTHRYHSLGPPVMIAMQPIGTERRRLLLEQSYIFVGHTCYPPLNQARWLKTPPDLEFRDDPIRSHPKIDTVRMRKKKWKQSLQI